MKRKTTHGGLEGDDPVVRVLGVPSQIHSPGRGNRHVELLAVCCLVRRLVEEVEQESVVLFGLEVV
jgi:hypothetical protein